uniref:Uncharacterized protein n=1 Tax=Romanomermis culicivorax TaxID=13658 RepID=A0A915JUN6_ROMCU
MTSSAESIGVPGGGPWVAKRAGGAGCDAIMLMSPVVLGIVDGCAVTGVAYFGSGSKGGVSADAVTTAVAKNPTLITQTG